MKKLSKERKGDGEEENRDKRDDEGEIRITEYQTCSVNYTAEEKHQLYVKCIQNVLSFLLFYILLCTYN